MIPLDGRPILTAAAMRTAENAKIAGGTSVDALVERAGSAIAEAVARFAGARDVLVLCGPGNNGADGYVAATRLRTAGHSVRVAASHPARTTAARRACATWSDEVGELHTVRPAAVLVDALFGTGLARPLDTSAAASLRRLAEVAELSIAVDLPSGVATDDGTVLNEPPAFTMTLALGAAKPAHLLQPAAR
ncbi:MAG TPA: NAD(P)H-hydrate epimerase, partial [Sphingomonas sp.]|nr:NAD(P)H-hydrate epimerase [Sphingomonas sp.]